MADRDRFVYRFVLRTGRRVHQNLYLQLGKLPANEDPSVGWATTPEIAGQAARAVNAGEVPPGPAWFAEGSLIYNQPRPVGFLVDWVIAVESPDLAERIARAARGVMASGEQFADAVNMAARVGEIAGTLRDQHGVEQNRAMLGAHLIARHGWGLAAVLALPYGEIEAKHRLLGHHDHGHGW